MNLWIIRWNHLSWSLVKLKIIYVHYVYYCKNLMFNMPDIEIKLCTIEEDSSPRWSNAYELFDNQNKKKHKTIKTKIMWFESTHLYCNSNALVTLHYVAKRKSNSSNQNPRLKSLPRFRIVFANNYSGFQYFDFILPTIAIKIEQLFIIKFQAFTVLFSEYLISSVSLYVK